MACDRQKDRRTDRQIKTFKSRSKMDAFIRVKEENENEHAITLNELVHELEEEIKNDEDEIKRLTAKIDKRRSLINKLQPQVIKENSQ